MNYVSQLLFFFGAVGIFNGLILASYLLFGRTYSALVNKLFGLFLLILSLRVLKSLFYAFSTDEPIWFLQSGPAFFLLIGPALFNYVARVTQPESLWSKKWKPHFLFWTIVVLLLMIFLPFWRFNDFNKTTLLPIINFQWLLYIVFSGLLLIQGLRRGKQPALLERWLIALITAILILWFCLSIIEFEYFITGSIIFSCLFYAFFLFLLLKKKITSRIFVKTKGKKPVDIPPESQQSIQKLKEIMQNERLYTNPNLKVADLAEKMGSTPHDLSKLLNEILNQNFTEFVNTYRVQEAMSLMATNQHYTIEAIGNLSGFNSKSAFYKAFKAQTGTTPARFKK